MEGIVFLTDNTNPDPVKDRRGCYKRGMVLEVRPDGFPWARMVSKATWLAEGNIGPWPNEGRIFLVKAPWFPIEKASKLMDLQKVDDSGVPTTAPFRRREWYINIDALPVTIRTAITTNAECTVTRNQVNNRILRIRDNTAFTDF